MTPEQLHQKYDKDLFHFVLGKTKDKGTAEDVCQETWARTWARNAGAASDEPFDGSKGWLFKVAVRIVSDHFRFYKRRPTEPLDDLIARECRAFEDDAEHAADAADARSTEADEPDEDEDEDEPEASNYAIIVKEVGEDKAEAKAKKKAIKARDRVEAAREKADAESNPERRYLEDERSNNLATLMQKLDPIYRAVLDATLRGMTLAEIAEETEEPLSTVKARYYRGLAKLKVLAHNAGVRLAALNGHVRCGSIECRPEKWVFYAGK
ncbi:MAG: sigma-70 family RNA polymerase sigma factor [Terracidiphilus sp.]|nr:sigma-70 family RNA polymerase sigma factor [Terracidiphilus sp.]